MGSRVDGWTGCGCISELASELVRQTLLKKTGFFSFFNIFHRCAFQLFLPKAF